MEDEIIVQALEALYNYLCDKLYAEGTKNEIKYEINPNQILFEIKEYIEKIKSK